MSTLPEDCLASLSEQQCAGDSCFRVDCTGMTYFQLVVLRQSQVVCSQQVYHHYLCLHLIMKEGKNMNQYMVV